VYVYVSNNNVKFREIDIALSNGSVHHKSPTPTKYSLKMV